MIQKKMLQKTAAAVRHRLLHPLKKILHDSRSIGIILLGCTFLSLLISNIPSLAPGYLAFWHKSVHLFGQAQLPHTLLHWINDGWMALFFLLAGMEIKRELVKGELSNFKKAALPAMGAIGGMLMPAIIYLLFNKGSMYKDGWGIPMATDIAFSLGVASLLGKRVPIALKIFLTALAIIDDLGAIIVIALFYGGSIRLPWVLACVVLALVLYGLLKKNPRMNLLHYLLGILLWYCMFNSGIHATVAGVVFALLVPVRELHRLETSLHNPVYFFIMPVFALANTAIAFPDNIAASLGSSLSLGIMAGLFIGKPLGIVGLCYFMVKRKYGELPSGTSWYQMTGAGILAGIGFTMSIFISTLAFSETATQDMAKISVLLVSFLAMLAAYAWLRLGSKNTTPGTIQA